MAMLTATLPVYCGADHSGSASQVNRTKWYREAKFGMFIHWGPYSLASVEASWSIMEPEPQWGITEAEYRALPQRFDPVKFDPRAWVRLAKAAGQRYMVFTTKHHDGFCMFDSSYTNYKVTNTPFKRDIAAELAAAAKAEEYTDAIKRAIETQRQHLAKLNSGQSDAWRIDQEFESANEARSVACDAYLKHIHEHGCGTS